MADVVDACLRALDWPDSGLWPAWLGGAALAAVAVGFAATLGKTFGVSGLLGRVLDPVREMANDREAARAAQQAEAFARALAEATRRTFGIDAPSSFAGCDLQPGLEASRRDTWVAQLAFVVGVVLGAGSAAAVRGDWGSSSHAAAFNALFGSGFGGIAALFVGGMFVGFGTQFSGGCTSGHGLVGCARLRAPSLVATGVFLGTAVIASLLLSWGLS